MINLDSILKGRDITLPTRIHLVKAMVFPVVMYRCESWTIKKAEGWRSDAFELWCWRRLVRALDWRKQSWIVIGRTDSEGEVVWTLTLWKRLWCWERLKAGREGDERGWDGWMASPTQWTWVWASSGSWWWTGKLGMLQTMGSQRVGHDWMTELNWLTFIKVYTHYIFIPFPILLFKEEKVEQKRKIEKC